MFTPGSSAKDVNAVKEFGIPVCAIDGNNRQINMDKPNGLSVSNVDRTDLLRKMLEISGGKTK